MFAIVRATYRLAPSAKLLYGLLIELDRTEHGGVGGASMSYVGLARQLGLGADNTGDLRLHLHGVGLVIKVEVPGLREAVWFPTLPEQIERQPPRASDTEAKRQWVREQADLLDRHIQATEPLIVTPVTQARARAARSRGVHAPYTGANVLPPGGGRGARMQKPTGERAPASEGVSPPVSGPSVTLKGSKTTSVTLPARPQSDTEGTPSRRDATESSEPQRVGVVLADLGFTPCSGKDVQGTSGRGTGPGVENDIPLPPVPEGEQQDPASDEEVEEP